MSSKFKIHELVWQDVKIRYLERQPIAEIAKLYDDHPSEGEIKARARAEKWDKEIQTLLLTDLLGLLHRQHAYYLNQFNALENAKDRPDFREIAVMFQDWRKLFEIRLSYQDKSAIAKEGLHSEGFVGSEEWLESEKFMRAKRLEYKKKKEENLE